MAYLLRRKFRRTTLILACCLAIVLGVALSITKYSPISSVYLIVALPLIFNIKQKNLLTIALLMILMFGIGWQRGAEFNYKKQQYLPLYGHKISLTLSAKNDASYGSTSQFKFDGTDIRTDSGLKLVGKIQVSGYGENSVLQNDRLRVTGKLMPSRGSYQARMSFASLKVTEHHPSLIADVRRRFTSGLQSSLPEPLASFAIGILIGQRTTLPDNIKQELIMVGLTHIIAVSGYNLTIMLGASQKFAGKSSKKASTLLAFGLITLFILLTGSSASIVRAAIVSTLSITAGYYNRTFKPVNIIAIAVAITVWQNPFYLLGDASWYLSFLAFFGILVIAPQLVDRLPGRYHDSIIINVAIQSMAAELMTLPYILFTFGQMSMVGLIANVLVVALVPLAMLLSLIAGLAGMTITSFAGWFAWPATILLNYMLDIAHILSTIPHGFMHNLQLSISKMIYLYIIVISITLVLINKTNIIKGGKITERRPQHQRRNQLEWT